MASRLQDILVAPRRLPHTRRLGAGVPFGRAYETRLARGRVAPRPALPPRTGRLPVAKRLGGHASEPARAPQRKAAKPVVVRHARPPFRAW